MRADGEAALRRGADALWQLQDPSGRFSKSDYGIFREGQSLTGLALESLLRMPARFDPPGVERAERVRAGLSALLGLRHESGALGLGASMADYPCYATALFVSCLALAGPRGWREHAAPSIAWLRAQQLRGEDGWEGHPARGGFGMGSEHPRTPPDAGHVDASMTRRALEALRLAGAGDADPAFREARPFIARCRGGDGGFRYSPSQPALDKGRRDETGASLGYGSATADALLACDAAGMAGGELGRSALAWLRAHHRVDENPGVGGGPMAPFAAAMRGYYRAAAARGFRRFGGPPGWRAGLVAAIAAEQRADGSWRNESPLQKEDDPTIATAFAVDALTSTLHDPGEHPTEHPTERSTSLRHSGVAAPRASRVTGRPITSSRVASSTKPGSAQTARARRPSSRSQSSTTRWPKASSSTV